MMRFKSRCVLLFPFVAVCLTAALFPFDAICAGDDDEIQITLPTKNKEPKNKEPKASSSSATQKKEQKQTSRSISYETMLQGVVYDLKQTRTRQTVSEFKNASGITYRSEFADATSIILRNFVNGTWQKHFDIDSQVSFTGLNQYYFSPARTWNSCFCLDEISSTNVPQKFTGENDIKPIACVFIYSGYVMAPFSGRFRFVGYGDDYLVVRFQKQIVLDYGNHSATLGSDFTDALRTKLSGSGDQKSKNPIERKRPGMTEKSYYTENKLVTFTPTFIKRSFAKGPIIEVKKGDVIPIEILTADLGGEFSYGVFFERVTVNGDPLYGKTPIYQLFRTDNVLPSSLSSGSFTDFDKNGFVWKVVNINGKPIPSHIKATEETGDSAESKTAATATSTATKPATATTTSTASSSSSEKTKTSNTTGTKTNTNTKPVKLNPFGSTNSVLEED